MSEEIKISDTPTDEELTHFNERFDFWEKKVSEFALAQTSNYNFLEKTKPAKAIKILMMLEEQEGQRAIMAACDCNWQTIRLVSQRHAPTLQEGRKDFSRMHASLLDLTSRVAYKKYQLALEDDDELSKISVKDLAIAAGIYTDKGLLLDGMATVITETRQGPNLNEAMTSAAQMIEAASQRIAKGKVVEAEIITKDAPVDRT